MAIAIAAIILVTVNMGFFGAHKRIEAVTAQSQAYQTVRLVMDRMIKDLICSYVPITDETRKIKEDRIPMYRFIGTDDSSDDVDKDSINFTTTADLGLPGSTGVICEVGYSLKEMEEVKDRFILIRSEDCMPHAGISETAREMEVAENIVSMDIKYIDGEENESDVWDLSEKLCLPKQVNITITFEVDGQPLSFSGTAFLPLSDLPKLVKSLTEEEHT